MSILDAALAHLADQMQTHLSVPITYSRDGASVTIQATRGSTPYEATDADGIIHRTVSRDYLIHVEQYPFTDLPRSGDLIHDAGEDYVIHSMTGSQPYRFSDPHRRILRVHCKKR